MPIVARTLSLKSLSAYRTSSEVFPTVVSPIIMSCGRQAWAGVKWRGYPPACAGVGLTRTCRQRALICRSYALDAAAICAALPPLVGTRGKRAATGQSASTAAATPFGWPGGFPPPLQHKHKPTTLKYVLNLTILVDTPPPVKAHHTRSLLDSRRGLRSRLRGDMPTSSAAAADTRRPSTCVWGSVRACG